MRSPHYPPAPQAHDSPPAMALAAQARYLSSGHPHAIETQHHGWWVVCNTQGQVIAESHLGSATAQTFWRSTAKLLQALPLVEAGLHHNKTSEQLAVTCSSHTGSRFHQAQVEHWLKKSNLSTKDLRCGSHLPVDTATRLDLLKNKQAPCPLHHNCSGKHAGMLAVCQYHHWPLETYTHPEHPLQQAIQNHLARRLNLAEPLPAGIDGCGVPAFYGSLGQLASLYALLSADELALPLLQAITQAPKAFGGEGRIDSTLVEVTQGRCIAKVGADGVMAVMNRDEGLGMALKIEDGDEDARNRYTVRLLNQLQWLSPSEYNHFLLMPWTNPTLTNASGTAVGQWLWM